MFSMWNISVISLIKRGKRMLSVYLYAFSSRKVMSFISHPSTPKHHSHQGKPVQIKEGSRVT